MNAEVAHCSPKTTETLEAIATDPDANHLFYSSDFDELLDLVDAIFESSLATPMAPPNDTPEPSPTQTINPIP